MNRFVLPDKILYLINITENLLFRESHQFLNIGTDIFHMKVSRIHHQEDVVHIGGYFREQLVTCKQLIVLPFQLLPILLDYHKQKHHGKSDHNSRHHKNGDRLHLIHAGIDYSSRHHTQNCPVLKIRRFID